MNRVRQGAKVLVLLGFAFMLSACPTAIDTPRGKAYDVMADYIVLLRQARIAVEPGGLLANNEEAKLAVRIGSNLATAAVLRFDAESRGCVRENGVIVAVEGKQCNPALIFQLLPSALQAVQQLTALLLTYNVKVEN